MRPSAWLLRLLAGGLAASLPVVGVVAVRTLDDRPALHVEAEAVTALLDDTIAALGPGRQATLKRTSAPGEPAPPFESQAGFGYARCDYWWNVVLPGWEAERLYAIPTHGDQDRAAIFATVAALWSTYDGELTGDMAADGGLALELDHSHYGLYVDQVIDEVVLFGATRCLPT